jgi:signal transduction histidine kinase/ligand-binding sensor domain-containing protein
MLRAQPGMSFSRYSLEQGLSQSNPFCIIQDKRGFIWIGTQDGLNKFDGYNFTIYRPSSKNNLSDAHILALHEDKQGILWIGTRNGGVVSFDYTTEKFSSYTHKQGTKSICANHVRAVTEDANGILWFGTPDGISLFNRKTTEWTHIREFTDSEGKEKPLNANIYALATDVNGMVWIGTDSGVVNYNPKTQQSRILKTQFDIADIRSLCVSRANPRLVWVGTNGGGLYSIEQRIEKTENLRVTSFRQATNELKIFSHENILSIVEDNNGYVWLGTYGGGLRKFNPVTKTFTSYVQDEFRSTSLANNFIFSVFYDRSGILWIGTYGAGLNKYDPAESKFISYHRDPRLKNTLSYNYIYAIYEDSDGAVWVGTNGGALNKLVNRQTSEFTTYWLDKTQLTTSPRNNIRAILPDNEGMLWLTSGDAIHKFNPKTGNSINYRPKDAPAVLTTESAFSFTLCRDSEGMLWAGTWGMGLYRFNPATGEYLAHYKHNAQDTSSLPSNGIYHVICDRKKRIWVATNGGGLCRFEPSSGKFISYQNILTAKNGISSNIIRSIYEDENGILWLGTAGGLNKFNPETLESTLFREQDGLPNNVVYGIVADKKGNLWCSTNKGIFRYNPLAKKGEKAIQSYDVSDGLQSNEFNAGAYHSGKSGQIYFGGINGLSVCFPDSVRRNDYIPPVLITGFKTFNETFETERAISTLQELEIPEEKNVLTFEFTALNFTLPMKNVYAYKLENFDKNWIYCGGRREATYTNLSGGTYIFRVKAANNDGVWNEDGAMIRVVILPPWWKRWWANIIWVTVVGVGVFATYKWRVRSIEERNKILKQTVDERTQEVQRQVTILNDLAQEIELANTELQDRNHQVESKNLQLAEMNGQLAKNNALLDQTLDELHTLNQDLESRIQARTAELRVAKEALEKSLVQEQEINSLRARLIASISHEFRTPITVIQSSCGILQRYIGKMNDEQRSKQFTHIEESSKRLVNILDSVIMMSTIENRPLRLMPADVVKRTEELVRDFNVMQAHEYAETKHTVTLQTEFETSVVNIDEESLRQILSHLISNAIKFSPPKSDVLVTFAQSDEKIRWTIQDHGMGIGDEDKPYIFDLFYRSEKNESSTIQGVGLGLSIVKKLVETLRGDIWFETEEGKGTTFFVELPILQQGA